MKEIYRKLLLIFFPLIIIWVVVLRTGIFLGKEKVGDKKSGVMKQEDVKIEDIKIGDTVVCIEIREDIIVKDQEYGSPIKTERITKGIITDIRDGETFFIKVETISDFYYVKKFSLWIPDLSVTKPPPFLKGDIYKCKPKVEEHEDPLTIKRIHTTIKKISSD